MSNDQPDSPQGPDNQKDEDAIAFAQGIFELARNGGAGPLSVMLNAGVPVDMRTSDGDSLLMLACSNGHLDTARLLLENGANPDFRNDQQQTPLMAAARSNQGAVIECLLAAGAQASLVDADGHCALDFAIAREADEAIRALS